MDENTLKETVAKLLADGVKLNDIQKILKEEHSHSIPFMELRLLAADLEVNWSKFDPKKEEEDAEEEAPKATPTPVEQTLVEISKIQRPGAIFSGSVTFLSGIKGTWFVDQNGGLGLELEDESQQPTEEDQQAFKMALQEQLVAEGLI